MKSKKGQESGLLIFIVILFCLGLGLGFMYIITSNSNKTTFQAQGKSSYAISKNIVPAFLESKIQADGYKDIDMADLIGLYNADSSTHRAALIAEVTRVSNIFFGEPNCWLVSIGSSLTVPEPSCSWPEGHTPKSFHYIFKTMDGQDISVSINY